MEITFNIDYKGIGRRNEKDENKSLVLTAVLLLL